MLKSPYALSLAGAALSLAVMVGAAVAEDAPAPAPATTPAAAPAAAKPTPTGVMKLRVTNGSVNPASVSVERQSKDIRERKAMTFTVTSKAPLITIQFANGVAHRGEVDLNYTVAVIGEDGDQYWCALLGDDGMEVEFEADCEKRVNKPK